MKETVDDKQVDGSDAGAVPATSTNSREEMYGGVFKFSKAQNNYWKDRLSEKVGSRGEEYYYTPSEWSRLGMWGPLPDDRNTELRGVNQDRRTDETLSEDSDTKT